MLKVLRKTIDQVYRSLDGQRFMAHGIGLDSDPEVVVWDFRSKDTVILTAGVHEQISDAELPEACTTNIDVYRAAAKPATI